MEEKNIRNFCIIAHIDHGKSTLADRMLEITHTVEKREMKEQLLDQMDIERERGITIKLAPVRMDYNGCVLNLIDTPGHVDFSYEVSRSLAAVEGAILLVDATQGIEAQTLSTLYAAIEHDLTIIPVINKIDLPAARPEEVKHEIIKVLGCREEEILQASGKTGEGVEEILREVIENIPAPKGGSDGETKALIFDSVYDPYRGVVAYVRVFSGKIKNGDEISLMVTKSGGKIEECGYFKPKYFPHSPLSAGEIGYIVTGFREVSEASVGDTITLKKNPAVTPLSGYKKVKPFVYASIFCTDSDKYPELKEAIEKLKLNDGSLSYEAERSEMLGHGFRCGFLGLLHLDIVRERLEREFDLDLVITSPTVIYKVIMLNGENRTIEKAADLPQPHLYKEIFEPWSDLEIITPKEFIGVIMDLSQGKRGIYKNTEYFDDDRVVLIYEMPLAELIIDYYDQLKSISRGYASLNYEMKDYRDADLAKIDILIAEDRVDALSFIINSAKAQKEARRIVERLKELIPRQNFEVKIQAAISANIIASERIPAMRKDVTAKLYGGDVTRKNKLLDKQKKGKKKMKMIGKVNIPSDVFIKVLRNE
jgi:GTP-binding protein LepA